MKERYADSLHRMKLMDTKLDTNTADLEEKLKLFKKELDKMSKRIDAKDAASSSMMAQLVDMQHRTEGHLASIRNLNEKFELLKMYTGSVAPIKLATVII